MSDRIAIMNRGRVEQVGEPEDVYQRPATTFVAGFIGVSNLVPATVIGSGRVRLEIGPEIRSDTGDFSIGECGYAVVRPEKLHVELTDEPATAGRDLPRVAGVVESSLYLGTATQLVVDIGGVRMTVLVPNADDAARQRLPGGGAHVVLSWQPEHMHMVRDSTREEDSSGAT